MENRDQARCTAFEGTRRIASGDLTHVALMTKKVVDRGEGAPLLIFDDATGAQLELDFRGTADEVRRRLATSSDAVPNAPDETARRGPGRPRLGVVAREITLLPRHWDWLNGQPGGASVALRKLVEEARRRNEESDQVRRSQEAAYRFMSAIAGNLPGFEESTRAFFAGDRERFGELVESWPVDVRDHAKKLAAVSFQSGG